MSIFVSNITLGLVLHVFLWQNACTDLWFHTESKHWILYQTQSGWLMILMHSISWKFSMVVLVKHFKGSIANFLGLTQNSMFTFGVNSAHANLHKSACACCHKNTSPKCNKGPNCWQHDITQHDTSNYSLLLHAQHHAVLCLFAIGTASERFDRTSYKLDFLNISPRWWILLEGLMLKIIRLCTL